MDKLKEYWDKIPLPVKVILGVALAAMIFNGVSG